MPSTAGRHALICAPLVTLTKVQDLTLGIGSEPRDTKRRRTVLKGLTGEYDAVMCIGFHSRAGTLGVLSHSFMGHEIEDIWLDGRPVGEIGMMQATAAAYGVPVVLLTGDDAACAEMTAWYADVATVPVKFAKDRFAAQLV